MSKRRNDENIGEALPRRKRFCIVQPLQESDVHNQPEDLKSESSQSGDPSTSTVSKAGCPCDEEREDVLPGSVVSEDGSPSDEQRKPELPRTSFDCLPMELQRAIISLTLTFPHGGIDFSVAVPHMKLAAVCRLWQRIVSSIKIRTTHQDWKVIMEEKFVPWFGDIQDKIEAWNPHTLQLGSVGVKGDKHDPLPIPPPFIAECFRSLLLLRRLILTCVSARDLAAIKPLADGFPELVELVLKIHPIDIDTLTPIRVFSNAPKLERVTVGLLVHMMHSVLPLSSNLTPRQGRRYFRRNRPFQ